MDFTKRLVIETNQQQWQQSPAAGVWRKPLEREAKESGHTTSIVQYEAGSAFSSHSHPLGEEIFVLEGVFSDEFGNYPAGTYIHMPKGSAHVPQSKFAITNNGERDGVVMVVPKVGWDVPKIDNINKSDFDNFIFFY